MPLVYTPAMRRVRTEKRVIEEEVTVTDDILCNQCGNSLRDPGGCNNFHGLIEVEVFGGYGATLGDQEMYKFSICEDCLRKLFAGFLLPPEHWDNLGVSSDNEKEHEEWLRKTSEILEKRRDAGSNG